jgi:large subunit ribosomal protein L17
LAGYKKLGRPSDQRKAMLRNLVTDFFRYGEITTTLDRAKETGKIAEKMITLGKRNTLHTKRQALGYITDRKVVTKLFTEIAPANATREGGYTRIYKLGMRRGDGAEMAILRLTESSAIAAKEE